MSLDSGRNYSNERKEPFGLMASLDTLEEEDQRYDMGSKITKKSSFSKKLILFVFIIILGLSAIFIWSWIFEVLGLMSDTPPVIENKIQTSLSIPAKVESNPSVPTAATNTTTSSEISPEKIEEKPQEQPQEMALTQSIETPTETPVEKSIEKPIEKLAIKTKQGYTIQILGLSSKEKAQQFIAEQPGKKFKFYETQHQQKPWFVVVYGDYATQQEAKAALLNLPVSLKQYHPWVRKRADIQDTKLGTT